jgi:hypothetical protein
LFDHDHGTIANIQLGPMISNHDTNVEARVARTMRLPSGRKFSYSIRGIERSVNRGIFFASRCDQRILLRDAEKPLVEKNRDGQVEQPQMFP